MIRTRLALTSLTVILAVAYGLGTVPMIASAATSPSVKLLSCTNSTVVKPRQFVITCADANTLLTKTHWTSWTTTGAVGTTRFGMNLCTPDCAASPISYFSNSTVHLSKPVATKQGRLFSSLVVRYKQNGKSKVYSFSWRGDPSF
jgi:hypothetical protein